MSSELKSPDEIAAKMSAALEGQPIGQSLIALAKVQIAVFMQIPESKDRLKAQKKLCSSVLHVLKTLSKDPGGQDVAREMMKKNIAQAIEKKKSNGKSANKV